MGYRQGLFPHFQSPNRISPWVSCQPLLLPLGGPTGRLVVRGRAGMTVGWGLPGLVVLLAPLFLPRLLVLLPADVGAPWVARKKC